MKKLVWLLASYCALTSANAQTQRLQLIEEFTGENCPPCASTNPGFNALLNANSGKIISIKYQSPIPSAGPLYNQNKPDVDARITYYGVNSAPNARHDGLIFAAATSSPGHPANFQQSNIDTRALTLSPFTINVSHRITPAGDSLYATAVIKAVQAVTGPLVAHMVVIEKEISFSTPPGTNGEKKFEGVMKKMLPTKTGTSLAGPFAIGDSVVINVSWKLANVYDLSQVEFVSFVQKTSTKEVLQAGHSPSTFIALGDIASSSFYDEGTPTNESTLSSTFTPVTDSLEDYKIKLLKTAPSGWSGSFVINGTTYLDSAIISSANISNNIDVKVIPGSTSGVGSYTLSISSVNYIPFTLPIKKTFKVISNVTDLIVDNDGDKTWENYYLSALTSAGNTTKTIINLDDMVNFSSSSSLDSIKNIYLNAGWGPNSLTDESVPALKTFLDNGGNLFLSGQDIGWQTWVGSSSTLAQNFYTNYLNADYISDASGIKSIVSISSDDVFGTTSGTAISDVYGSANTFTDVIRPRGVATSIFNYGTDLTKIAGIRSDNGTSKVVYLGVGVEMLTSSAARAAIIKKSYDWFYGKICTTLNNNAQIVNAKCFGDSTGKVNLNVAGGSGNYTYNWSNSTTADSISKLPIGTYTVTITDVNSTCSVQKQFSITQPAALSISGTATNLSCFGGSNGGINLTVSGGFGNYSYNWSNSGTTSTLNNLTPDTYRVTITDDNNCKAEKEYTLTQPSQLITSISEISTGNIKANAAGGTSPYQFLWSNASTVDTQSGLSPGTYNVTITDAKQCTSTASFTVVNATGISTLVKKTLTINPNPAHDYFDLAIGLSSKEPVTVRIYNILGTKVFEKQEQPTYNLNTRIDVSNQPAGIYFVKIETKSESITQKVLIK